MFLENFLPITHTYTPTYLYVYIHIYKQICICIHTHTVYIHISVGSNRCPLAKVLGESVVLKVYEFKKYILLINQLRRTISTRTRMVKEKTESLSLLLKVLNPLVFILKSNSVKSLFGTSIFRKPPQYLSHNYDLITSYNYVVYQDFSTKSFYKVDFTGLWFKTCQWEIKHLRIQL